MKSPTVTFRINPLLLSAMKAAIERYNANPLNEPHDVTSFCNQAISDKLAHLERGRNRKGKNGRPRKAPN